MTYCASFFKECAWVTHQKSTFSEILLWDKMYVFYMKYIIMYFALLHVASIYFQEIRELGYELFFKIFYKKVKKYLFFIVFYISYKNYKNDVKIFLN